MTTLEQDVSVESDEEVMVFDADDSEPGDSTVPTVNVPVAERTRLLLKWRKRTNQALVSIGGVRVFGTAAAMERVGRAFGAAADQLTSAEARADKERRELISECPQCNVRHRHYEDCTSGAADPSLDAACGVYTDAVWMQSTAQARLIVASAQLWLDNGDRTRARQLLHIHVDPTTADAVLRKLRPTQPSSDVPPAHPVAPQNPPVPLP